MYAAKEAQSDFKVYAAEQNQHSVRRLSVLSDIRHALASDEIVVHYQPIVDLDDLQRHRRRRPGPLAAPGARPDPARSVCADGRADGLIGPLTRHVLERSIAECAAWRKDGRDLSVAVNLSVRNLLDRDLPKEIERLLNHLLATTQALQLEITESMIMSDPERALATVTRLSDLGVADVGRRLRDRLLVAGQPAPMPIDELKIDRSFVSPMLRDESDLIIVRSTINLGHDLGLQIIAEGVEDGPTLEQLALLGCDLAQGYHLSRPMPADAFNDWLQQRARPQPLRPASVELSPRGARPPPCGDRARPSSVRAAPRRASASGAGHRRLEQRLLGVRAGAARGTPGRRSARR